MNEMSEFVSGLIEQEKMESLREHQSKIESIRFKRRRVHNSIKIGD